MNAPVRGWCPSLARPMPTGDGLLARLSPASGSMDAEAARAIAQASLRHGNGVIQITSRAAIQVRGLSAGSFAQFARDVVEIGFTGPARVVRPPLLGDDPELCSGTEAVCDAIERALSDWSPLPKKFAVAVDGGGVLPTGEAGCDVVVRHVAGAWIVSRGRHAARDHVAVGWRAYPAGGAGVFVVGLPFGTTGATALMELADRIGVGTIRPTPWRAFALTGPDACRAGATTPGFIADPGDPRLRAFACPGAPACASASVDARADAERIAALALPSAIHISGCAKGCAHAGPAALTLVGSGGRYDLVRAGRASDAPSARGLTLTQAIARIAA